MQNTLELMAQERPEKGPHNPVGLTRYIVDRKIRVNPGRVQETWYTARMINPTSEYIGQFAADMLVRVVKVDEQKAGGIKVYAMPPNVDGAEEIPEDDAVAMDRDGYFTEAGQELGYLLDLINHPPKEPGSLAAAAKVETETDLKVVEATALVLPRR